VAVYDLGAGTLDTAVVGPGADGGLDHLAAPPRPVEWGGRDVDDALLGHVLRSADGSEAPAGPDTARTRNLALRTGTVAAKEALSTETATALETDPGAPLRVTREELDELIDEDVRVSVSHLLTTIDAAGRAPENLHAILLAGGAVRTPLISERLSAELDVPLVVGPQPELTVAFGAARLAAATLLPSLGIVGTTEEVDAGDAPLQPEPDIPREVRRPARTIRRPDASGRRSPHAPRTRAAAGSGAAPGRRTARVLVVAGMFAALLLVPMLSAVFLTTVGSVPGDSVARAGGPSGTATPAAGAGPTAGGVPGTRLAAAAAVKDSGVGKQSSSATDASRTSGTSTGSRSAATGTVAPAPSGTSTDAPVSTAGTPVPTTAPTSGTPAGSTTPVPPGTTQPPAETTDPPAETTDPPAETTDPPVETSEPPVETTQPPAETTPPAETATAESTTESAAPGSQAAGAAA
jgi:hypothetical protein